MTETKTAYIKEFARLRRGPGLNGHRLAARVGPHVRGLCGLTPNATDADAKRQAMAMVELLASALPDHDQLAVEIALGMSAESRLALLGDRVDVLARRLYCEERTARRRIERAFARLADEAMAYSSTFGVPGKGWRVRRLEALLRLDGTTPELTEKRTIVATRSGLQRISGRFSLPRPSNSAPDPGPLSADVVQGARLVSWEPQGEAHFHFALSMPRALKDGEEHTYTIAFRMPSRQSISPHLAFVPLIACDTFQLRIRFSIAHPPASVWRLDQLPPRVLDDRSIGGPKLHLDDAGEILTAFEHMDNGFAYGAAWSD
jgi:hypothetical protein